MLDWVRVCEGCEGNVTDDLMFLLVENLLWKDLAGSVSPSLSEESSPTAETGLVEMAASFVAIRVEKS